jgi:YfiH family protein
MTTPPFLSHECLDHDGLAHGFFTRHGGVSQGVYDSLNCGFGSNDAPDAVNENRRRAASALGGVDDVICGLYQLHSATCHIADATTSSPPKGDALITNQSGITLAILTADCVPIILADHNAGVIGVAHAGWRGATRGIIASTLKAMRGLGAKIENICGVIGPAIQQCSYQVGVDLREEVLARHPNAGDRFIPDGAGKWRFDLPGFVKDHLDDQGVGHASFSDDTYSDDRFFSHRRKTHLNAPDTGRLVSMIRLKT